jgi:hypothetical protein
MLPLKTGGKDNGKPGLRADDGPDYHAAFAVDPDGYRIEAYAPPRSEKLRGARETLPAPHAGKDFSTLGAAAGCCCASR